MKHFTGVSPGYITKPQVEHYIVLLMCSYTEGVRCDDKSCDWVIFSQLRKGETGDLMGSRLGDTGMYLTPHYFSHMLTEE